MAKTNKIDNKYTLVTKNLQEIVGEDKIKEILKQRDLNIYWGTAITGKPHFGYFVPMLKIADFLDANSNVTILFANLHGYLDNMKSTWELLEKRTKYYEFTIKEMLKRVGVSLDKLKFVKGTEFQLSEEYTLDMYKMSALASTRDTQKAGAEVVKQIASPKMSGLLYPILQSLDEQYLDVDIQFGGVDQRKIFMFAREFLPKIGYEKRCHLMNPIVPGLGKSGKMSSSEPNTKIDFIDDEATVMKKLRKAHCVDGIVEDNGVLAMLKYVIFRFLEKEQRPFIIERPEKYGGIMTFNNYEDVEKAFVAKELASVDLKDAVAKEISNIINPLRIVLNKNLKLVKEAYPDK